MKCGGANRSGITVAINQGGPTLFSGTTNGSGNFAFSPTAAGTYNYTLSGTGFATTTGTITFACANLTVNLTIASTSNVVSGQIRGCNSTGLPGALVSASQGSTNLGTATTDSSGNYSITLTSWTSGSVTITGSKTRFNNGTTTVTPSSCGATTSVTTLTLSPTTGSGGGYRCIACGGPNPISETLTNSNTFGTTTLTYNSSSVTWEGAQTINGRIWNGCSFPITKTTGDFPLTWFLASSGFSFCSLSGGTLGCISGQSPVPAGTGGFGIYGTGTVTQTGTTTSPFSISYNVSYNDADGVTQSGTGTITE